MRAVFSLLILLALSACTYLTPHKIEIQQGNFISREAFERVKVGMSKSEVRTALGTPLLQDVFHNNRWDYYFSHDRYGGFAKMSRVNEERRITLIFENDKLARIEGDVSALPTEKIEKNERADKVGEKAGDKVGDKAGDKVGDGAGKPEEKK